MFGFFKSKVKEKAIKEISENLALQTSPHMKSGKLIGAISADAYVSGYIQGKLTAFLGYYIQAEGLPESDRNEVVGVVLMNVFGDSAMLVAQSPKTHGRQSPDEFRSGFERGMQIVKYALGVEDIRADRDYRRALELHRGTERRVNADAANSHWAAIAGLESLWFEQRIR